MNGGFSRRVLLVLVALMISAFLLHGQLSSALVWRGDALAYWGDVPAARAAYQRALLLDQSNGVAVDRLVFADAISRRRRLVRSGASYARAFLSAAPGDVHVRFDLALCEQKLGDLAGASDDFERVGVISRDPRALMFAALDRRRIGERKKSRELLAIAVAFDPRFAPARRALARQMAGR